MLLEYLVAERSDYDVLYRWDGQKRTAIAWTAETAEQWYVCDGDRQVLIGKRVDAVDYMWTHRETGGFPEVPQ